MLHTKCRFIWPSGFRQDLKKSANQKQELPVGPCLLTDRDKLRNFYRGPSIDATYQISVHLGKRFQRIILFRNQPFRNKNGLLRPCLLRDRDEMSNVYRCFLPSFSSFSKAVSEEKI